MSGIQIPPLMLQGREYIEKESSGEASTGHNQSNILDHHKWVKSIASAGDTSERHENQKARIHKVPAMLHEKDDSSKYYRPKVVSIGPYHNSKSEIRKEEVKQKMAKHFAEKFNCGVEATIEDWYHRIEGGIKEWRECYEQNSTDEHDDQALARMMLLDGCFILQYIDKMMSTRKDCKKYFRDLKMKNHEVALVQHDLFLLENQLPYGVLETLMGNKEQEIKKRKKRIMDFIAQYIIRSQGRDKASSQELKDSKPSHLLEFLRQLLLGCPLKNPVSKCCPARLGCKNKSDWHSFRNIEELIAVGIRLKRSDTACLRNVSYTPCLMKAHLNLPQIHVDDSTASEFLNLIAYEMCPGSPDDFGVTSYVCFLDSLIDHPDDVKQLRDAQVLHNCLGSDQEVADLFNNIGTDLVPDEEAYSEVKDQIQWHYDCKLKTWAALCLHEHFSTPWTVHTFIGATAALAIAVIQSYYALFPRPSACEDFCSRF